MAGKTLEPEALADFWTRYSAEHEGQLSELRELPSPSGGSGDALQRYFDRLARNVRGYRETSNLIRTGTATEIEDQEVRVFNSETDATRLAERAGLTRCSPVR